MTTGERIRELRIKAGLTQHEFGKAIGISKPNISKYENNLIEPSNSLLIAMASLFHVSIDYILGFSSDSVSTNIQITEWKNRSLGDRIRFLRKEKGLTQQELAKCIHMSDGNLSKYELDKLEPNIDSIKLLASFFNVSTDYLLGLSTDRTDANNTKSNPIKKSSIPISSQVPIISVIRAGYPIRAEENIEGYEYTSVRNPNEYYYLRVTGDSMIGAGIDDGSLVLVHEQNYADNGDIVVCLTDDESATLKRFRQQGRTVMLIPENPHYDPIVLDASEFDPQCGSARILGVAKKVVKDL